MSLGNDRFKHSEDYFEDTRMTFGEHLEELRTHLWRAVIGFGIAVCLSFFVGAKVVVWISKPVEQELERFYDRRVKEVERKLQEGDPEIEKANELKESVRFFRRQEIESLIRQKVADNSPQLTKDRKYVWLTIGVKPVEDALNNRDAQMLISRRHTLTTLSVQEAFVVYFKVCLMTGFVLASPWIFFQIWTFIAAGLYPHEKKYVNIFLPFSVGLFLAGVLVCEFFVIPKAIEALLWFNEVLNLEPDLRLSEWLSFAILMPLIFGLSFQTPIVMLFLERVGILTIDSFRKKRRLAWFLMAVFAAIITPSADAISMLLLWVPMSLLYELGILMMRIWPRQPWMDMDVPESDELIEV